MKKVFFLTAIALFAVACQTEQPVEIEQYTIEQFMDNTRVMGSSFSPDETKIAFSSNESGVYNIYEMPVDGGEAKQLTNREETSYIVGYFPNDERIMFSSDNGGNEIYHLFVLDRDSSITDITPWENARASFAGWTRDKEAFYVQSNKRDPRYMDLYKMDIENFEAELIFENTDGYYVGDISRNERYIALTKPVTRSYTKMLLYDREKDEIKLLKDIEETTFRPLQFSLDEQTLYFLTDENSEFTYLKKMNLETEESETVYEAEWDVMYAGFSYNEKYKMIGINQDAQTVIKLFDAETGEAIEFPDFPGQNITSVGISESETMMSFYVGSSVTPSNLYTYSFDSGEYTQLTNTLNEEINPDHLVNAEVVRYPSFDGLEIPSILYKPKLATPKNKVPALVWVHGGPGGQSRIGYSPTIQYLVNHGYAIIAVNNRGSSGYGKTFYGLDDRKHGDHDLKDCIYAKDYLAKTGWVDTTKIGIIGGSYGGYMVAAALTFTPEEFDVGVNIFGVTNWLRTLKSIPSWWEAQRKALYKELGDPAVDSAYLYKISPLFHAENITKPLMVLQGANDPRVLKVESDEIVEAARNNGVPVEYVVFDDEGHGFRKKENQIEAYGKVLDFLDEYLKETAEKPAKES